MTSSKLTLQAPLQTPRPCMSKARERTPPFNKFEHILPPISTSSHSTHRYTIPFVHGIFNRQYAFPCWLLVRNTVLPSSETCRAPDLESTSKWNSAFGKGLATCSILRRTGFKCRTDCFSVSKRCNSTDFSYPA